MPNIKQKLMWLRLMGLKESSIFVWANDTAIALPANKTILLLGYRVSR